MNLFDNRASTWDNNPVHWERSEAIAQRIQKFIPANTNMVAMEYGARTGILSFLLRKNFAKIMLMDNSKEMIDVMHKKIMKYVKNELYPVLFDLEYNNYSEGTFDCIFNQMVMHHIADVPAMIHKFHKLLNPGGYLAIADLYSEDGSFHGNGFIGHDGFDPMEFQKILSDAGFTNVAAESCYVIKRYPNEYPIILYVAQKR